MLKLTVQAKIRAASLAAAIVRCGYRCAGRGPVGVFERAGLRWNLDLREGVDFSIWLLGAYEASLARFFDAKVRPGAVVLDIGANIGAHTLRLARCVGEEGKVHAIEPTAFGVGAIRTNLGLNPGLAPRVDVHHLFLAESDGEEVPDAICASWPLEAAEAELSDYCGLPKSTGGARALALDTFVGEQGISRIDLIKLDVDGHETSVLWGGAETIERLKPDLVVELAPFVPQESGRSFAELVGFLTDRGYVFSDPGTGRDLPRAPERLLELIPDGAARNVFATCPEAGRRALD